jgi:hypothetical protein
MQTMKKKDRYKLISYAIDEYNTKFNSNCKRTNISVNQVKDLLKKYKHSTMVEWYYCCYGLYHNCWQELVAEGNWDMSQESVNDMILFSFEHDKKTINKDRRVAIEHTSDGVNMYIIMRDKGSRCDSLITFRN